MYQDSLKYSAGRLQIRGAASRIQLLSAYFHPQCEPLPVYPELAVNVMFFMPVIIKSCKLFLGTCEATSTKDKSLTLLPLIS